MKRGSLALIASCLATLPLTATAQEQLSLDDYFKGTALEGQITTQPSDFEPLNRVAPASPISGAVPPSNFTPPPLSFGAGVPPRTTLPQAPGLNSAPRPAFTANLPGSSFPARPQQPFVPTTSFTTSGPSSGGYDRSQLDPLTGLPLHMTSLGMGPAPTMPNAAARSSSTPFTPGMLASSLGQSNSGAVPASNWNVPTPPPVARQDWSAFPTQQPPLSPNGVAQVGHTGPILFAGNIEPLQPGETISTAGLPPAVTFTPNGLPTTVPLPDRTASSDSGFPELQDFGDLSTNLLNEFKTEPYDRAMDDLCVSRKGYVVLEHWGWHAAALAGRRNSLGITTVQGSFTLSFPQLVDGLTVRPQFGWHELSGPSRTDMPGQLFDVMVEGGWRHQIGDRTHVRVAGTAGLYTDFDQSNLTDGVRVSGLALGSYEVNEDLQLVLGAAVINLANRRVLPIAGVVYHPNDDVRMELMFPEGRISQRIDPGRDHERWVYLANSFFGRTWNITRSSGVKEDVTYSDWRVGLGIESHLQTRAVWYLELGASLGRQLEYESHIGDYDPSTTGYLRGGIYY